MCVHAHAGESASPKVSNTFVLDPDATDSNSGALPSFAVLLRHAPTSVAHAVPTAHSPSSTQSTIDA